MKFAWMKPSAFAKPAEVLEYLPNSKEVLTRAFWMSGGIWLPQEIWSEIFRAIDDYTPDSHKPIEFLVNYFANPVQIRKNPFVVCQGGIESLVMKPNTELKKSVVDLAIPEALCYSQDFSKNCCQEENLPVSIAFKDGIQHGECISYFGDLIVGVWVKQNTNVTSISIDCCDGISFSFDLNNPLFKMLDGVVYGIPSVIFPIYLTPFTACKIIIDPPQEKEAIKLIYSHLNVQSRVRLHQELIILEGKYMVSQGTIQKWQHMDN